MTGEIDQKAVAKEFDQYRDKYSEVVNDSLIIPGMDVDYFTKLKASILIDHANRHFNNAGDLSVIDVGCGVGNYHTLLDGKFDKLVGVDVSEESIEKARTLEVETEFEPYDGTRLSFEDSSFDIAFAICVVHHVPVSAWPSFFSEIHRVMKPGGHAMIFEHNPLNPLTMRVVNRCPFDKDAILLRQFKTKELLEGAGFKQVYSRTFLNIPSFGPLTRKLDQAIGVLPTGAQYLAVGEKV